MDQFCKRERKSSVFSARTVASLIENLEKTVKVKGLQPKECPELKTLKDKCCSDSSCEAFAAFQGIIILVEKKILITSQTLSSLISLLPAVVHYTPLVMTIGDILLFDFKENLGKNELQYNFTDKLHPFITLLKYDSGKSWDAIFSYIQFSFHSCKEIKFTIKIQMLKTVFQYVFLEPALHSVPYKHDLFGLLLEQIDEPEIKYLIFDILTWQNLDINYCCLIQRTLYCLLGNSKAEHKDIIVSLTPTLAAAIKWLILNGHNPILWIDLLSECLEVSNDGCSAVLCILSDVLLETPSLFINKLLEVCSSIIYSSSCNKFIAHKFAALSLIWMVNPSSLAEPLFKTLECIIKFLAVRCNISEWNNTGNNLNNNPYFNVIKNSNADVKFATELTVLTDGWNKESLILQWLKSLSEANNLPVQSSLHTTISAIFLSETDDEILDICSEMLLKASATDSETGFLHLCLTFFKLGRESNPKRQLKYLQSLVGMANSKENVPLILSIIETLKNGNKSTMWPTVIDLYLKLWKVDKRTFPYLQKALLACPSHSENSWELNVIKTVAIRDICMTSPEIHGKSLVSKLSEVLNDCDNYDSGIPSAIAIEAVIELCKASVTDIAGTWRTLKPKLSRDKRTVVIISLCKLFGEIMALKPPGSDRDALINDVIPRLWNYALSTNAEVVKAALGSLAKFNAESYGPKLLPDILKNNIDVQKQYSKATNDISSNELLDELPYVPGECWIEFMHRVDLNAIEETGNMLRSLIEEELKSLPRRHFCHADETPERTSYAHLPNSSICRALVQQIKNHLNSPEPREKKVPAIITEMLRILSLDYSKCLPCLDWSFLENFFTLSVECERYSVLILAKQSSASKAGRKLFETYVVNNLAKFNEVSEFIFLYNILPHVCNSLGANSLRLFLVKTIKSSCNSSIHSGTNHFENVLTNIQKTLESKIVPEPRKALLVAQIQSILVHIPPEHKVMQAYADFATVLPPKAVECMASPSSWPKVTSEKIRRSLAIKRAQALRPDCLQPLSYFDEILVAVSNFPRDHDLIINSILEVLQKKRDVCHVNWMSELMWKIQNSTPSANLPESVNVTLFLLDIFIITIVTISGYDFFLLELEQSTMRKHSLNIFPVALFKLLKLPDYSSLSAKIIDFIPSLSKWKSLPEIYVKSLEQSILTNRHNKHYLEKSKWQQLFYISTSKLSNYIR